MDIAQIVYDFAAQEKRIQNFQWLDEQQMSNVVIKMDSKIVVNHLLQKSYLDAID